MASLFASLLKSKEVLQTDTVEDGTLGEGQANEEMERERQSKVYLRLAVGVNSDSSGH